MSFTTLLLWIVGLVYAFACLWLILIVLLQEGKSGGMSQEGPAEAPSAFTDTFGAGGAQKNLFRMTAITAGVFFILAIVMTELASKRDFEGGAISLPDKTEQTEEAVPNSTTSEALPATGEATDNSAAPTGEAAPAEKPAAEDAAPANPAEPAPAPAQ